MVFTYFFRHRIRIIAPTIKTNGVEYLHLKFKERLDANPAALDHTKTWLVAAKQSLLGSYFLANVHNTAIMALVTKKPEVIPETLELDEDRLQQWHQEFHYQVRAAAFVLTVQNQLHNAPIDALSKHFVEHDVPNMIEYIMNALGDRPTNNVLRRALSKVVDEYDNALYQLVAQRLRYYWLKLLEGAPIPANKVLLGLAPRVENYVKKVKRVCELNRAIYGEWYNQIIG